MDVRQLIRGTCSSAGTAAPPELTKLALPALPTGTESIVTARAEFENPKQTPSIMPATTHMAAERLRARYAPTAASPEIVSNAAPRPRNGGDPGFGLAQRVDERAFRGQIGKHDALSLRAQECEWGPHLRRMGRHREETGQIAAGVHERFSWSLRNMGGMRPKSAPLGTWRDSFALAEDICEKLSGLLSRIRG